MDKIVNHLQKKALNGIELLEALNYGVNIVPYHELNTLDQVMTLPNGRRSNAAIILYEKSYNNGHYTALLEYPSHFLFFDPYGSKKIDDELMYSPYSSGQRVHLLDLLRNQSKPYHVSKTQFQTDGPDINTCGRHCLSRIKMHHLTEDEYKSVMKGDSDKKAVMLTMFDIDLS